MEKKQIESGESTGNVKGGLDDAHAGFKAFDLKHPYVRRKKSSKHEACSSS